MKSSSNYRRPSESQRKVEEMTNSDEYSTVGTCAGIENAVAASAKHRMCARAFVFRDPGVEEALNADAQYAHLQRHVCDRGDYGINRQ